MATADDQINAALRLLGVLAEGETPSVDTAADALNALNQMLDSWSTESLSVYGTIEQVVTWPAGERIRTLGPTGNLGTLGTLQRPVSLEESTYYNYNGISYDIDLLNQLQYDTIALKTAQSSLPVGLFVNYDVPDITMYMYPVPTTDIEMHFVSVLPLAQITTSSDTLIIPPGYLRAFKYNLAVELAPEFGISAPKDVKDIARTSKKNIRRINNPGDLMRLPSGIMPRRYGYNIYTGPY